MSADGRNGERLQEVGVEIDTWWNVNPFLFPHRFSVMWLK